MKSVVITSDHAADLYRAVQRLTRCDVLVGVPEDKTERKDTGEPTNAMLAYLNNFGSPAQKIPAREFMYSGIHEAEERIAAAFRRAGRKTLAGGDPEIELNDVGLAAQNGIKRKITEGPFQPLADSTIYARAHRKKGRRKGAIEYLALKAEGKDPPEDLVRPLIDSGQMRRAISFVVRKT